MKRNKLFLPFLSSLSIVPCVAAMTSCGEGNIGAKNVAEAITTPLSKTEQKTTNFKQSLKDMSENDKKRELVYDLFGSFNLKGLYSLPSDKSITDLYNDKIVGIKTNITKAELAFDKDDNLIATFLGYVSFVFTQDYNNIYKTNDYVMLTFDIDGQTVTLDENNCSLKYEINDKTIEHSCVGFAKIKKNNKEVMQYFTEVDTNKYSVKNYLHYVK